jgi:hypothetical protein
MRNFTSHVRRSDPTSSNHLCPEPSKELENDLGVQLFERSPRGTHLTWAGQVFLEDVRRVFTAFEHCRGGLLIAEVLS